MASADFADLPVNHVWLHLVCSAATAAAYLEDPARCQALHGLLEPYADHVAGTLLWWVGSVSHYLGLLAAALGRLDEADIRFAAAETANQQMEAPAWVARTRLERARTLLARQEPGDPEQARHLLRQALTSARELGLADLERRVAARLQGCP
jgi:hypothetical protein